MLGALNRGGQTELYLSFSLLEFTNLQPAQAFSACCFTLSAQHCLLLKSYSNCSPWPRYILRVQVCPRLLPPLMGILLHLTGLNCVTAVTPVHPPS